MIPDLNDTLSVGHEVQVGNGEFVRGDETLAGQPYI